MGRFYSVPFSGGLITQAIDVFEVVAPSTKGFYLHEVVIAQSSDFGDSQAEGLSVYIKRATGSYTTYSSGIPVTPEKNRLDSAASACTAKARSTVNAIAGAGTITTLRADGFNVQNGYQYIVAPQQRYYFNRNEACIVSMTAPADSLTLNGTLVFEEV